MKQQSQEEISWYLLCQLRKTHIDKPVVLEYAFYEPNKKRDLDNVSGYFHKVFQDALVKCKILHNDIMTHGIILWVFPIGFFVDNYSPRIEVTIKEVW